jgi:hypothetical protein
MICSSRARNRSFDPVICCFFGRIDPSDADKESCFVRQGNLEGSVRSRSREGAASAYNATSLKPD